MVIDFYIEFLDIFVIRNKDIKEKGEKDGER